MSVGGSDVKTRHTPLRGLRVCVREWARRVSYLYSPTSGDVRNVGEWENVGIRFPIVTTLKK